MSLRHVAIRNYRSLATLDLDLPALTVVFGPCGVGKSSFLDTLWFVRDCLLSGVAHAASRRDHGIGLLWDGADPGAPLTIAIEVAGIVYELAFTLASGRVDERPGERLTMGGEILMSRSLGSDSVVFLGGSPMTLRDPGRLALEKCVDRTNRADVGELESLLRAMRLYSSRTLHLHPLRTRGSETSSETVLEPFGRNLWSVLRNLAERRKRDERYETIRHYMSMAFPDSFSEVEFEQTGSSVVYAAFVEPGRINPIKASGVSDGHLQLLIILTALFGDLPGFTRLIAFDEPEISLHPWPLAVMAEAIRHAVDVWKRQVVVASHSPVLLSQFEPSDLLVAEKSEAGTTMRWLAKIPDVQDLLEHYTAGSIYMGQAIAPQGGKAQTLARSRG